MRAIEYISDLELPSATPAEIDTVLADLHDRRRRLQLTKAALERSTAQNSSRRSHMQYDEDVLYNTRSRIAALEAEVTALDSEIDRYNSEYQRRPWNRYFLVNNAGGHVHRGMNCSTCFPTTQYMWIVDLADCNETEMIHEYGERACTVCFPDAPTHPAFDGPGRRDMEAKANLAQERAERAAIKAAKTLEEDHVFRDLDGWKVTTVAGAKTALRSVAEARVVAGTHRDNGWHTNRAEASVAVETSARVALEHKGVPSEDIDLIMERAAKKARKTWGV